MGKLTSSLNISLNGHCGHEAGIHDEEAHTYFVESLKNYDALLFGRKTFELFESYWPKLSLQKGDPSDQVALSQEFNKIQKFVIYSTRQESDWINTSFISGDLQTSVNELKKKFNLLSLGSVSLMSSLLQVKVMDELELLVQPLTTVKGPVLFSDIPIEQSFKLIDQKTFNSGVILLQYKV